MQRLLLAGLSALVVALLAGCGGSGDRTASIGDATVTVPSDVSSVGGELKAILDQFPYQHWYTACVDKRFGAAVGPDEEEALSELSVPQREEKLDAIIAKAGPACERSSSRSVVDPNASTQELDLLRVELEPMMTELAESNHLDATQTECLTEAFEKLPDRYIVQFGNGDQKTRRSILLTIFKTCAESG